MSADFPDLIFPHELPYITSLSGSDLIYLERPNGDGTYTSYATSLSALITGGNGTSGYSGYSGASGYYGQDGASGYSGYSGRDGAAAGSGYSGYSGVAGASGYSGGVGASGYSGQAGTSGFSGQAGTSGYSGQAGTSGYSGVAGQAGTSGYSGAAGQAGASGYSGETGADGASGYSGQAGTSGYSGAAGISGYSGKDGVASASGYSGYSGDAGVSGYSGEAGASGYSGVAGTSGYSGSTGADGASGYSGEAGTSGYSGVAGASGYSGSTGADGVSGYSGEAGTSGYSGQAGTSGYSGYSGEQGEPGVSGFAGADGDSGYSGISGYSGEAGASGYSGGTGADGASGYSGQAGASGYSGAQFTYSSDLVVSLSNGKTFGRFVNGDVIPATGKTPAEVIQMAIAEALAPTVSLTSSTTVAFNQTAISNVLNFSYTINSYGASVSTAVLEWRRNNTGTWTTLTNVTSATTYTHTITDTNYNTQPFNYRYTVVDTSNGTANATKDITPASYVAPSVSLAVTGTSIATPESNAIREHGNVSSNISGSVSRNSANVALTSYQLQYQSNGGSWVDIGTAVSIGPGTTSITPITHNESSLKTSSTIGYRVKVIDAYQTYLSSQVYSSTSTVTFYYALFYGPSATAPTDSAAVRALPNKQFTTYSNPFNLNTGVTYTNFTVAMPATLSLSSVIDLDSLNVDITSSYVLSTFNVDDGGSTATSYNVYTLSTGAPYSPSHRHQITRA